MDEEVFNGVTVLTDDIIEAEKNSFEIRKVPLLEIGGLILWQFLAEFLSSFFFEEGVLKVQRFFCSTCLRNGVHRPALCWYKTYWLIDCRKKSKPAKEKLKQSVRSCTRCTECRSMKIQS